MTDATLSGDAAGFTPSHAAIPATAGEYGGFWIRTLAYSADFSILIFGLTAGWLLSSQLGGAGEAIFGLFACFGPLAYFVWFTSSARRATIGKQLCGLKVEHAGTGERISILRSLGRELGKYVSAAVLGLGFLMIGFTRRKQGLHDLLATTAVVRESPARILLALIVTLAGILIPIIVVAVMFGAMFAGLVGMMLGGDGTKQLKSVPRIEQPVRQLRPAVTLPQTSAPAPMLTALAADSPVKPETAKPEAAVATSPKVPAAPETPIAISAPPPAASPAPAPKPTPEPAPVSASGTKPVVAASRPPPLETIDIPLSPPGPSITPRFNDLTTAVMYGDADAVAELLRIGKWADKPDSHGVTPLALAVQKGDVRSAELLLRGGADPNRLANHGTMLALLQQHGLR